MTIAAASRSSIGRQSLGCEAELLAHGFHAALHDGAAARDFLAKLSETGGVAQGIQPRKLAGASGPLANAFGVGSEDESSIATGSDPIGINPSFGSVSIDLRASRLFSLSPRAACRSASV